MQKMLKCTNRYLDHRYCFEVLKLFALMTHTLGSQGGVGRFFEKKARGRVRSLGTRE